MCEMLVLCVVLFFGLPPLHPHPIPPYSLTRTPSLTDIPGPPLLSLLQVPRAS